MWNEDDLPVIISKAYFALSDIADIAARRFLLGGNIDDYVDHGLEVLDLLYAATQSSLITYEQYETILNCLIKKANLS